MLRRERALRRQELAESLSEQPPVRFCMLEPRRVLNASFDLAGPNLNLLNFAVGTNLDISHSSLTNSYEFALSSGTWQDSLGADTGSNLLVVLDSVLTGTLSVDSALATDISLGSNLETLDQVLLMTQGAVSDAPGTQLQTNSTLSITAGTVLIGEQLTDSYQLGELNLDTQGLTQVHAVGNLVVASADSTNDVMLVADSLELQSVDIDGSLTAQSRNGDILVGSLVTSGDILLTAQGGSILDAQDDVLIDLDAGGVINLTADQHILAFGVDQFLEVADDSQVTARSLVNGNIQSQSFGSVELTQLSTADGNMTIRANGVLAAIDVDSSATDSAANFINLTATGPNGNLEIHRVVAGTQNARVSLVASVNVLDSDSVTDDLDVSAKTVSIHAQTGSVGQQVGVIGSIFQEAYQATAGVEILWTDSLTINAGTSVILNPTLGTGVATLNSANTVVISDGDLDASNIDVSGSTNVALIADADQSGSGSLTLPGNVSAAGDLRIQGADVASALPLSFNASRFMLISGQAESVAVNSFIPNSLVDLDSRVFSDLIVASQSDLRLVDLNGDNFSVSSSTGSIVVVTDAGAIEQLSEVASSKNLLLRATDDLISSARTVASGNLSLIAGDDVQLKSLVQTTAGGTVFIEAGNSKADGSDGILMSANSKIITAHSNTHLAAGNGSDITVQSIDVGKGSLSLVAEGSILGATASHLLTANALRLEADAVVNSNRNGLGSIGLANPTNGLPNANSLAIHTQVNQLSAISAEGIYLVNTGSVVVGTVNSVVVQRVNRDGTLSQHVDRSLSDLTTTKGPIKLQTIDGGIRVTDGNANSQNGGNSTGVSTQAGDVLIQALGLNATITLDSAVRTQGGAIHVAADLNILQNSDLLVAGGVNNPARNSIVVESLSGAVVMSGTALTSTQDGNIVYSSAKDTSLGQLTAGLGSVAVVAGGSILDSQLDTISGLNGFAIPTGQARVVNIQALDSSLRSGSGIGAAGNALDVDVSRIAVSALGSAYLYASNGLVVGSVVAIDATRVHLNSTTANVSVARLEGAVSTNSHVKLETQLGQLEIASAVTAQQDVMLVSGSDNVVINDTVQSQDGAISVLARQTVQQNANLSITTGNDPVRNSVLVHAVTGSITMQPATTASTRGGNIAYLSAFDVSVGILNAGSGSILIRSGGSILDAQADTVGHDASGFATRLNPRVENLIANSAQLIAGGSVGISGNPLDTSVDSLAISASGSVYVYETDGLTIGSVPAIDTTRVHLDSTTTVQAGSQLSGVTSTTGHAKLETIRGSLTVGSAVSAQQDVLLASGSDNVVINDTVQSQDGAISVLARQTVQQNANLSITTGNDPVRNSVLVQAVAGSITMQPATTAITRGGNIAYLAATDVSVGVLNAGSGSILIRSGGSILEAQADTVGHDALGFATSLFPRVENLIATSAQLVAGGSVGVSGNPLDTSVDKIAVDASDHVYLLESTNIEVGAISPISYTNIFLQSTFETVASQQLTGIVSQAGHVKLETLANEIRVSGSIAASNNIELATANDRIVIDATITSQVGAVSIVAGTDILQNADIQIVAARDPIGNSIYAQALNGSIDMSPTAFSRTAAGNIVYQAAQNIALGQLNTTTGSVGLQAGGIITDSQQDLVLRDQSSGFAIPTGAARVENVIANRLSIQAFRVGTNNNPLDINAQVLAIAVQESASLLETNQVTIGSVPEVRVTQNHLDSTQQVRSVSAISGALAANGFFNLQSLDGSIVVDSNANAGVVGGQSRGVIASTEVLIAAGGSGDLVIESSIISQQQDAWLAAGRFLVTPLLQVGGTQTAVVEADHLTAYAGTNIFLPNTAVDTVEFKVAGGINVLAPQQLLNHFADQAGTLILNQLQHGPTNTNPNITTPSTPISTDSFQAWQDHFRFTERFSDGYTVFLRNVGSLTLQEKNFDRSLNVTGQQPGVYLETLKPVGVANAPSDLVVSGKNTIISTTTNRDPGIVLIADQNLVVQGSIELVTPLAIAAPKNQVLNQLALNASAYHAGLGDPQSIGPAGHAVPATTEYVVDPIRSQTEDYRTHVHQRVLMEFGSVGESGFLTMVHYADNAFEVFQNQGEVSSLAAPSEFALQPEQTNLMAIGNTTSDAALFTRSTDFTQVDRFFLQNNRDLPTDVVIRRSLDYFLFSNAQSTDPNQIIDHTSFAQEIVGVKSLGTPSLGPITPIPDGIAPPDPPTRGESAQADRPLSLILPQIELKQVKSEAIEVAIFRIGFDDRNSNGQVETTELPAFDDVLNRVDLDSKLPISSKNAGQSPSQGEVDEVKSRLLETPDQPSGAYAIIRKNADGKQEVLDVFSVRDWPEESKENGDDQDEADDENASLPNVELEDQDANEEQNSDAAASIGFENRTDTSQSSKLHAPVSPIASPSSSPQNDSDAIESARVKEGAAVLCALWLLHQNHVGTSSLERTISTDGSSRPVDDASDRVWFSRQDRLRRRAKSAFAKMINNSNQQP